MRVGFFCLISVTILLHCKTKNYDMDNRLEEIRNIFHQDKDKIIQKYSATGAGIGKKSEQYIIVVYTKNRLNLDKDNLYWKDIPLKLEYIGEINIQ